MTSALNIEHALASAVNTEAPDWLAQWQRQGLETFQNASWPTRKTEHWKYTPLKSLLDVQWSTSASNTAVTGLHFDEWDVIRLDFVNGVLVNDVALPDGVSLVRLVDADEKTGTEFLEKLSENDNGFLFDSLNQALLNQAYWLKVDPFVIVGKPIHLNYVMTGESQLGVSHVILDVAANASAKIIETFCAEKADQVFANANTKISLGENAQLTHYHLLLEEGRVWHIGRVSAVLNRASRLTSFHMAVGGVVKRKDIAIHHRGEGAELSLNGVYLPKGREIIDYHTSIDHEVPHCTSEEIFRGIIGDSGKAVFNGRIHIHKDAQKSLAEMNNRNLLLSDQAEIDTKPELEIYADDVKCTHGATIAQLDEKQLFYFQSRGISKAEAEVMLSFGFINELLDGLADEPVQNLLRPMLASLFAQKQSDLTRHLL